MINILLLITVVLIVLLGLVAFFSNPKKETNRFAALFIGSSLLWTVTNYLTNISSNPDNALIFARSALVGAALIPLTFVMFVLSYTGYMTKRKLYAVAALPLLIVVLSPTSLNVVSTEAYGQNIVVGYAYFLVFIEYVGLFWYGFHLLLKAKRKSANYKAKKQIDYIIIGCLMAIIPALITNAILPAVGLGDVASLGPIFTLSMVIGVSVAILRYGLLDFRLIIVRSVAYILSIFMLVAVFAATTIPLTRLVIPDQFNQNQRLVVYTIVAVVLALVLQPIREFFNKITNKIFYKDAYETQNVLDKVSSIIVGNVDPHKIQKGALAALADALKPSYMTFLLIEGNEFRRGDLVGELWERQDGKSSLYTALKQEAKKVIVYDELEDGQKKLQNALRERDISVVSPLVTKDETIGYLVLGPKKSGNIYNSQDVGLLNIASNELAVALQNAQRFEEIQAFNITLQEKVTEATRELKRTNRKLIALDEAKDEFISMASHQLRTPLTSIKGYLSMLVEGDLGKVAPGQEKALKEAFGSSQRMVYLIADFLNVSRIKTGKFVIELKEVDLPQMVSEEITQLREMASSRDITLEYEPPGVFPKVRLDDNKIRQVMMNMVDNAIYYTQSGGKIVIQLYVNGEDVIFKVVDNGIGVPKREQHKLFTKFFRANNAKKARPDGTGLGLFMAQKVIVEQGGAVIFESVEDKGSTFGFRFPLKVIQTK
jgi:signal transduction histidine kinase